MFSGFFNVIHNCVFGLSEKQTDLASTLFEDRQEAKPYEFFQEDSETCLEKLNCVKKKSNLLFNYILI